MEVFSVVSQDLFLCYELDRLENREIDKLKLMRVDPG